MNKILIIGIGASAGGLKEIECFFKNMPSSKDAAFVIIQHLSPNHKSILAEIITRYTKMKVSQIKDKTLVKVGHVYIIPPNKQVRLKNQKLILSEIPEDHRINLPIDIFFRSLKNNLAEKAIAVILSGTGTDGSLGIKEVKEEGGLTIVQKPNTADYDGMPQSAIKTGLIDFILPVEQMPKVIMEYIENEFKDNQNSKKENKKLYDSVHEVLDIIKAQTGSDFSQYKKNTIYRRIERRLAVHKLKSITNYVKLLKTNTKEVEILYKEFLISVTNFFRDKETFDFIKSNLIEKIIRNSTDNNIRIWVPACATGEEAYSWSMLFDNYIKKNNLNINVQIFASDIDEHAIEIGRNGFYNKNIINDVPNEFLDNYFDKEKNGYRIKKSIRETVIFAPQNFIQDPPYSKLNLVSCRNFLIYLDTALQQKAISIAHYALNQDGILLLGNSESLGTLAKYFKVIDRKSKIFQKINGPEIPPRVWTLNFENKNKKATPLYKPKDSIPELARTHILNKHTPPSVVVDFDGDIVFAQGKTGKYLEITTGEFTASLLNTVRDGLRAPLSNALRKAKSTNKEVVHEHVRVKTNSDYEFVNLTVSPLKNNQKETKLFIILFQQSNQEIKEISHYEDAQIENPIIEELEKELIEKEKYLQSTIEELETTNEELKSVNEELTTTNNELSIKVNQINDSNSQIKNLLAATNIATIFLDKELKIFNFTPAISSISELQNSDIGRYFGQFTNNLEYDNLINDAKQVLKTLIPKEIEVPHKDNKYFWVRMLPYRTLEDKIDGVVITFTDITHKRNQKKKLEVTIDKLLLKNYIIDDALDGYDIVDENGRFTYANKAYLKMWGYENQEQLKGTPAAKHCVDPNMAQKIMEKVDKDGSGDFKFKALRKDGAHFDVFMRVSKYVDKSGIKYFHGFSQDITEKIKAEQIITKQQQLLKDSEQLSRVGSWELGMGPYK